MFEIRVTVEAPDVCAAIRELAAAMGNTAAAAKPALDTAAQPPKADTMPNAQVSQQFQNPEQTATQPGQAFQQPQQFPQQFPQQGYTAAPQQFPQQGYTAAPQQQPQQTPAVRQYSADEISQAGARLIERGLMPQLIALLGKFNIQSLVNLRPDQYPAFAAELKALGADL